MSLPLAVGLFAVASVVVWVVGARLSRYALAVSNRLGLGKAFVGMLILGGITSLPELATTVTAALDAEAQLAVNNLLGGVSLQVALLAVVDAAIGASAFSAIVARPSVMLIGVLDVLLLAAVLTVILLGELGVARVGVGATSTFFLSMAAMWIVNQVIADRTPLGDSFVGVTLLALATSLPELSTTLAAARLHQYEMAFADIFGTNLFDLGLIFVADIFFRSGPLLVETGRFAAVAAILGLVLTSIYLFGLIERRDRVVLRMGYDSLTVLAVYAAGLYVLYRIR